MHSGGCRRRLDLGLHPAAVRGSRVPAGREHAALQQLGGFAQLCARAGSRNEGLRITRRNDWMIHLTKQIVANFQKIVCGTWADSSQFAMNDDLNINNIILSNFLKICKFLSKDHQMLIFRLLALFVILQDCSLFRENVKTCWKIAKKSMMQGYWCRPQKKMRTKKLL